jgi:hypothetical protein
MYVSVLLNRIYDIPEIEELECNTHNGEYGTVQYSFLHRVNRVAIADSWSTRTMYIPS